MTLTDERLDKSSQVEIAEMLVMGLKRTQSVQYTNKKKILLLFLSFSYINKMIKQSLHTFELKVFQRLKDVFLLKMNK